MTQPIPEGYHSLTPSFTFKDSKKAIDFYQKAFGAKAIDVFPNPGGRGIMHAVVQIGDSLFMMGDEAPGMSAKSAETVGHSPISLYLYVKDADALFAQAVQAGGQAVMPMTDMFWGDRAGTVQDPFGYIWMIATHKQDITKEQVNQGAQAFMASFAKK